MESIAPILSAAGIGGIVGGIVTNFLQSWQSRRAVLDERRFSEKREAYAGFLKALYQVANKPTPTQDAMSDLGYWRARVDLIASDEIRGLIRDLFDSKKGSDKPKLPDREMALLNAMRADLGITTSKRN